MLTCTFCPFKTNLENTLKSHMTNLQRHKTLHDNSKWFECKFCLKKYPRKDMMKDHTMTHIRQEIHFECPVLSCNFECLQYSSLTSHLDSDHNISAEKPGNCKICRRTFDKPNRLLIHFHTGHEDDEKTAVKKELTPRKCKINDSNCSNQMTTYLAPLIKKENVDDCLNTSEVEPTLKQLLSLMNQTHESQIDLSELNNEGSFERSESVDTVSTSTISNASTSSPTLMDFHGLPDRTEEKPLSDHGTTPISTCLHCGITFNDIIMYSMHSLLHSEQDPFQCGLCGVQCQNKYTFALHVVYSDHSKMETNSTDAEIQP
ncbi:hypothetical protein CRE_17823 [Caenorhabditis remanei]|uniref:C2H2-type domain-containing protein n=1 Tax=Caenorhabditis remanei TaxID=31234 RepID=E3MDI9_CAERE|nr:hypothetical protein CRE_17823 [Caenorhabditis remanei]